MIRIAGQTINEEVVKRKLVNVHDYLEKQMDGENANKIRQLAKKLQKQEFTIAFCGHFSAGKSTMINKILGADILPSSPIPTSANLVKVKSGEDYAKVYFKEEKPRIYLAPYDYNLVKNYCKDGDQIAEIEVSDSRTSLPAHTAIMDTPGIDSADDAHRIATESALHLADLIFYVMDYNHVQAELNFLFTKELTEAGKEVCLVINQIDKHREEEIRFTEFKQTVATSFAAWGVKLGRIFYTSLKKNDHPLNEFSELQLFIAGKIATKDEFWLQAIDRSLKKIAVDHLNQKRIRVEEKLQAAKDFLNHLPQDEKEKIPETFHRLRNELEQQKEKKDEAEKAFDQEISKIMKNAYLLPFETRELAEAYLTARQPEFKVGFLFAKKKTDMELKARLDRFYQDILAKTKSQIEWHIREYLGQFLKKAKLDTPERTVIVQSFTVAFPPELLINAVKPGAGLTGEYILHYCNDAADVIKAAVKKQLAPIKEDFLKAFTETQTEQTKRFVQKFKEAERYFLAFQEINQQEIELQGEQQKLQELLQQTNPIEGTVHVPLFVEGEEEFEIVTDGGKKESIQLKSSVGAMDQKASMPQTAISSLNQSVNRLRQVADELKRVSKLIEDLPGFQMTAQELSEKASRLEQKGFTVALFGAFSAGKSSFANALMGVKVLPVSPNPTTAAINKVMPVTDENPHGTVLVKFKAPNGMLRDVNHALKIFGLEAASFSEALAMIDTSLASESVEDGINKTHLSFLQAFKKGFRSFDKQLGTVYKTTANEFAEFVANEEKSCFVELIELYFDCELTRKGITLVDTPGADSINARHTGVSFDYIKNADAILFVTYYNHAFSKADREFLIQLGRVKDSFQLDKMFFIINAIDLAENDEEKEVVEQYVSGQLNAYGIRNPHLYSLSSLLALKNNGAAADPNSGMPPFRNAFYTFIEKDLTNMAVSASVAELNRVIMLVDKLVRSSKEDKAAKQQERLKLELEKQEIHTFLSGQSANTLRMRLEQEAEELLYYIKQRVFYRFGDFFKEAFNPSVLKGDGRNIKKSLNQALDEFLQSIGFDFAQEMRATTIRLDRFAEKILNDFQVMIGRKLSEINPDLSLAAFEFKNEGQLLFEPAFEQLDQRIFAKALAYFKNPKSFFEKNEKKRMSDEIYDQLSPLADDYLKIQLERLSDYYRDVLAKEIVRLTDEITQQVEGFYVSLESTLGGGVAFDRLIEIQQILQMKI